MAEKRSYKVQEIQEIMGISRPTVYKLLQKNLFRWTKLNGGSYRISKKSFDDWWETNKDENVDDMARIMGNAGN